MNEEPSKPTQPSNADAPKNDALKTDGQTFDDLSLAPEAPEEMNKPTQETPGVDAPTPDVASPKPASPPELPTSPIAPKPPTLIDDFSKPQPPAVPLLPDESVQPQVPPVPTPKKPKMWAKLLVAIIVVLLLLGAVAYGAYRWGNSRGYTNGKKAGTTAANATTKITVPTNATMVAQCTEGEGTQYIAPSNIPQGPIYNVWKNKVTGIEYMLGASEIAAGKTQALAMMNQKYDHIDVMYEAAGHAGFTEPHYHIILSFISYAEEQKITCGGSSSSGMSDMSM